MFSESSDIILEPIARSMKIPNKISQWSMARNLGCRVLETLLAWSHPEGSRSCRQQQCSKMFQTPSKKRRQKLRKTVKVDHLPKGSPMSCMKRDMARELPFAEVMFIELQPKGRLIDRTSPRGIRCFNS